MALAALGEIQRQYAQSGLDVLVVADDSDPAQVQEVMDSAGVALPFVYASGSVVRTFHSSRTAPGRVIRKAFGRANFAMPSFLVIDSAGVVRGRSVGVELVNPRLQSLRAQLDEVLMIKSADHGA